MRRYHIGSEDATKAIVVSKAMRRAMDACESPARAIESLSQKISVSTLLYDSCDEDVESPIRPELRVEPVVSTRKTTLRRSSKSTRSNAGRKRPIEDMAPIAEKKNATNNKKENRTRSDSVAEEVAEKIGVEANNNTDNNTSLRTPVVRGKRGLRSDDADSQGHKRMRV